MKLKNLFFLTFFSGFFLFHSVAQIAPNMYWVQFTDKTGTPFSILSPEQFLSERAIERRVKQNIDITSDDLPVNPVYVDSLRSLGVMVRHTSKWLNGAVIYSTDYALLDTLHHLSFVAKPVKVSQENSAVRNIDKFCPVPKSGSDYGLSKVQIEMLHGNYLHNAGFRGEGKLIAVLDAGFLNAREIESLQHLWENNQVIAYRDFVSNSGDIFNAHIHGTLVLSILAGIIPDQMYGSAPEANYILVRTENTFSEFLVEEYNWVAGAEYADSLGADVINSSLGYSLFDYAEQDHLYSDLNGRTTPAAIGASTAARKGILVCNSAGNAGDNEWFHILTPADADSILTVGAVNESKNIAGFSSRGPSFDGRIKPDVCAVGAGTAAQYAAGSIFKCNGTSCSSPIIAGMAACLWQSVPEANAMQIRNAILKSSDRFEHPDSVYGYGIPDFLYSRLLLNSELSVQNDLTYIELFPLPVTEIAYFLVKLPWLTSEKTGTVSIFNLNGQKLTAEEYTFNSELTLFPISAPLGLEKGYYILRLSIEGRNYDVSFIKL
jgi:hypothetical protein